MGIPRLSFDTPVTPAISFVALILAVKKFIVRITDASAATKQHLRSYPITSTASNIGSRCIGFEYVLPLTAEVVRGNTKSTTYLGAEWTAPG